jgi:hypothetical protein
MNQPIFCDTGKIVSKHSDLTRTDTESVIDVFMNRLLEPTATQMKHLMNQHIKLTPYTRNVVTSMIKHNNGVAEKSWGFSPGKNKNNYEDDGHIMTKLYVKLPKTGGNVILKYGNSELLNMSSDELYQINRTNNTNDNSYVELISMVCISTIGIPICNSALSFYMQTDINIEYVAEFAVLSRNELRRFAQLAHEELIYQYDRIDMNQNIMDIHTRFPISDIYYIYPKLSNNWIKFSSQSLINSDSPIYNLAPSITSDELKLYTSRLSAIQYSPPHIWNSLLAKGTYSIETNDYHTGTLIIKYVAVLMIEAGETYITKGLINKPLKESYADYIIQKYKSPDQVISEIVYDESSDTQKDKFGIYWEGQWFKPRPTTQYFPVKKPTNTKVDSEFLECLSGLLPQMRKDKLLCIVPKCEFTNQILENQINGFDTCAQYSFSLNDIKYKFYGSVLHDYTVLNIQPSETFRNAVIQRSKYYEDETKKTDYGIELQPIKKSYYDIISSSIYSSICASRPNNPLINGIKSFVNYYYPFLFF